MVYVVPILKTPLYELQLQVCLFGKEEVSLRDAIREGVDDHSLTQLIREALIKKRKQHAGIGKTLVFDTKYQRHLII